MLSDFSREKIREAVRLTGNDMEKSLQLLLDGGLQGDDDNVQSYDNYGGQVYDSKPPVDVGNSHNT